MKRCYTYSRSWPGRDNLLNNLLLRLLHALSVDVMLDYWNVKEYWGCFSQACMRMHRWLKNVNSLLVTQWTLLEKENIRAKVTFFLGSLIYYSSARSFTQSCSRFLPSFLSPSIHPFIHPSIRPSARSFVCTCFRSFIIHLSIIQNVFYIRINQYS